jgi:hypothetical protein
MLGTLLGDILYKEMEFCGFYTALCRIALDLNIGYMNSVHFRHSNFRQSDTEMHTGMLYT